MKVNVQLQISSTAIKLSSRYRHTSTAYHSVAYATGSVALVKSAGSTTCAPALQIKQETYKPYTSALRSRPPLVITRRVLRSVTDTVATAAVSSARVKLLPSSPLHHHAAAAHLSVAYATGSVAFVKSAGSTTCAPALQIKQETYKPYTSALRSRPPLVIARRVLRSATDTVATAAVSSAARARARVKLKLQMLLVVLTVDQAMQQ